MLQQQKSQQEEQPLQQQQLLLQLQEHAEAHSASPEPPVAFPENHLLLVVSGSIDTVHLWGNRRSVICRYAMVVGSDWRHTWGLAGGISQEAHCATGGTEVAFNFPFHAAFKGTSPYGWPRMAFCIYGRDWLGRQIVAGYAHAAVPVQPGRHQKRLAVYSIVESSTTVRFVAWLKAQRAEFIDLETPAKAEGREVVRAESAGELTVSFEVLLKGAQSLGYSF